MRDDDRLLGPLSEKNQTILGQSTQHLQTIWRQERSIIAMSGGAKPTGEDETRTVTTQKFGHRPHLPIFNYITFCRT